MYNCISFLFFIPLIFDVGLTVTALDMREARYMIVQSAHAPCCRSTREANRGKNMSKCLIGGLFFTANLQLNASRCSSQPPNGLGWHTLLASLLDRRRTTHVVMTSCTVSVACPPTWEQLHSSRKRRTPVFPSVIVSSVAYT